MKKRALSLAGAAVCAALYFAGADTGAVTGQPLGAGAAFAQTGAADVPVFSRGPLSVSPRELDLGAVAPGATVEGRYTITHADKAPIVWTMDTPGDWTPLSEEDLIGDLGKGSTRIRVLVKCSKVDPAVPGSKGADGALFPVQIRFESEDQAISFEKKLALGSHAETLRFITSGGATSVLLKFEISTALSGPAMNVDPPAVDFGAVEAGKDASQRILVTNKGTGVLKWRIGLDRRGKGKVGKAGERARYVSFQSEESRKSGSYTVPAASRDSLAMTGKWAEENGYPLAGGTGESISFKFTATAVEVILWKAPDGGSVRVHLDDRLIGEWSGRSDAKERAEIRVAEKLADKPHELTLSVQGGAVTVEGLRLWGKNVAAGPPGWVKVSPDNGTTTREIDYVNVRVQTARLKPGTYSDTLLFDTNGGEVRMDVSLTVLPGAAASTVTVYRYMKGPDQFLTADPAVENPARLRGYERQGLAFRLFSPGTPGTTEFYRAFNARTGAHFYTPEKSAAKLPAGYDIEGPIGSIATVRLAGTRELYRWHNPATGFYFFTTHSGGEGLGKKGYRFDGIAGYVR